MRILFCDIAWMEEYNGANKNTIMSEKEIKEYKQEYALEGKNFHEEAGMYYGYASIQAEPRAKEIHIEKFKDITEKDYEVSKVLVIWTAINPENQKDYIVGWYKDATVFRYYCFDDENHPINIECKKENGIVVEPEQRIELANLNNKRLYDNNIKGKRKMFFVDTEFGNRAYVEPIVEYINRHK